MNELIKTQMKMILFMDGFSINLMKLLTSISHKIYYRTAQNILQPDASVYKTCVEEVIKVYCRGGFVVTNIHCDSKVHKAIDRYTVTKTLPIKISYLSAQAQFQEQNAPTEPSKKSPSNISSTIIPPFTKNCDNMFGN